MGYYIDPPRGTTKEDWLEENGELVMTPSWPPPAGMIPVCLVDNGPFTAAGICFDEAEFNKFRAPDPTHGEVAESKVRAEAAGIFTVSLDSGDQRPRTWYYVPIARVIEVSPRVAERLS